MKHSNCGFLLSSLIFAASATGAHSTPIYTEVLGSEFLAIQAALPELRAIEEKFNKMKFDLEKHRILATQEFASEELRDHEDEFSRETRVFVSKADHPRAHRLFYEDDGTEI